MNAPPIDAPPDSGSGISADDFRALRSRMMSIAYRMLGSVVDAEDAVQDAFLRLHTTPDVRSPEGFLVRTTTRRCIDTLRTRSRNSYVGPWLPEPVDTQAGDGDLADSLTQAFLLLLERLSPEERAAFLLRAVFDYEYSEVAEIVQKSEAAVRQLVSRARQRIGLERPRFNSDPVHAQELTEQFLIACRSGDLAIVESLLTKDIAIHSDGGGKALAARVIIDGPQRAARFLIGVTRKHPDYVPHPALVNNEPGIVFTVDGKIVQVLTLHIDERIRAIYIMRNPDKLTRWGDVKIL